MGEFYLSVLIENNVITMPTPSYVLIISLLFTFGLIFSFYVLRSIGLYKLAGKNGIKRRFLAWFPGLWVYVACKLIGRYRIFGTSIEKLAILFCILFTVAEALVFAYQIILWIPLIGYYLAGGVVYFGSAPEIANVMPYYWVDGFYVLNTFQNYGNVYAMGIVVKTIEVLSMIFEIITIFILVNVYLGLFRKFWPQHFLVVTILALLNKLLPVIGISLPVSLFGIFVFVIRNRKPINYADYIRSKQQGFYNTYGNPYQNSYNQNPYNQNPYGQSQNSTKRPVEEPFSEFGGDNNDPFSEFNRKNGDDK